MAIESEAMKRAEYLRLKDKIEARYKRDMEALERVWAIANEGSQSTLTSETVHEIVEQASPASEEEPAAAQNGHGGPAKRFSLRREIEKMLPEFGPGQDITQGEVRHRLERRFPDHGDFFHSASVSSALRRIAQSGDLVLVSTGSGNEPNRYRKPGDENARGEEQEEKLLKP